MLRFDANIAVLSSQSLHRCSILINAHVVVNPSFFVCVVTVIILAVEIIAKKKVEDVMPIATGHEKEELEAELEVLPSSCFFLFFFV